MTMPIVICGVCCVRCNVTLLHDPNTSKNSLNFPSFSLEAKGKAQLQGQPRIKGGRGSSSTTDRMEVFWSPRIWMGGEPITCGLQGKVALGVRGGQHGGAGRNGLGERQLCPQLLWVSSSCLLVRTTYFRD